MGRIQDLPAPLRRLCETHLHNFFRLSSRGRNALAQIWHGRPIVCTAIYFGDCEYVCDNHDAPEFILDSDVQESQAWFESQSLGRVECETPSAGDDICSILHDIMKPAIRSVAVMCLAYRWAGSQTVVIENFTAADVPTSDSFKDRIGDWMEGFGLGGVISHQSSGGVSSMPFSCRIILTFIVANCAFAASAVFQNFRRARKSGLVRSPLSFPAVPGTCRNEANFDGATSRRCLSKSLVAVPGATQAEPPQLVGAENRLIVRGPGIELGVAGLLAARILRSDSSRCRCVDASHGFLVFLRQLGLHLYVSLKWSELELCRPAEYHLA